jgi:hypothetical protein
MPTAKPASTTAPSSLSDAIDSATANPQAHKLASEALLVPEKSSAKRKRAKNASAHSQRYEVCIQCHEEYDVLDNDEDACEYHPGK